MNTRSLTIAVSTTTLLLLIIVAGAQNHRASTLHAEQMALLTQSNQPAPATQPDAVNATRDSDSTTSPTSPELLQLRSQVGQLMQRRHELQTERTENEHLRGLVSVAGTNAPLPAGYIRRKQARWVGQNTPDNTLESFLWAVENRNTTKLLSLLAPRSADELNKAIADQGDAFFNGASMVPGMHIVSHKRLADGSIEATIEVMPGQPVDEPCIFRMIDGQWKMDFTRSVGGD